MDLTGKTCLITGAANGLGFEYARGLAALGATVVINDLGGKADGDGSDASAAERAARQIVSEGGSAIADTGDVTDEDDVEQLIDRAFAISGHLDVLVCNAGALRDKMLFNLTPEDWDVIQRVHLRGHFLPLHFAARRWRENSKKQGATSLASVVLTSSRSGLYSSAGQANYASAKAGIASLAIIAARELEQYGVRTNAIAPMAKTRLTEGSFGQITSSRWDPANVTPMIAYLAGDDSIGINGQVFIVGGGRVEWMRPWTPQGIIESPDGVLTLEQLVSRVDELFGGSSTTPAAFPTATWA